jgi:DNA polymerase-3 subunit beta
MSNINSTREVNSRPIVLSDGMKFETEVVTLAAALDAACSIATGKVQALAHLAADTGAMSITSGIGNVSIEATIEARVIEGGEIAVDASKLSALVDGFDDGDTVLTIAVANGAVKITGGDGAYRLPATAAPQVLAITGEATIPVEITGEDALRLFEVVEAAESEKLRYYLAGVHLDSKRPGYLTSVATNGGLLLTATAKTAGTVPPVTIPTTAIEIATKVIKAAKPAMVSLRRDAQLLEIAGPNFRFTTRLIETAYPEWRRVLPPASQNTATIEQRELVAALVRLSAIVDTAVLSPVVALSWEEGAPVNITLLRAGVGSDQISGETNGTVRVALLLNNLLTLVQQFNSMQTITIEAASTGVTIADSDTKLGMLSFTRWNFDDEKEAAA